jgi:hypothetical protein
VQFPGMIPGLNLGPLPLVAGKNQQTARGNIGPFPLVKGRNLRARRHLPVGGKGPAPVGRGRRRVHGSRLAVFPDLRPTTCDLQFRDRGGRGYIPFRFTFRFKFKGKKP